MINKICKINSVGSFKEFDGNCLTNFKRYNFIFGENGTGKTILSKLFCLCSEAEEDKYKEEIAAELFDKDTIIEFNIADKNEKCKVGSYLKHKIHVFNSNFVTNHLYESGGNIQVKNFKLPTNIRLENQEIKKLSTSITDIKKELEDKEKEHKKVDESFKKVAAQIREEYNEQKELEGTRLTIDNKKLDFQAVRAIKEIDKEIADKVSELKITKFNDNSSDVTVLAKASKPSIDLDLSKVKELLLRSVKETSKEKIFKKIEQVSQVLGQKESQQWFQNGYKILTSNNDEEIYCPLCNSEITGILNSLMTEYEGFFSKEFENFQTELSGKIQELTQIIDRVSERRENHFYSIFDKYTFLLKGKHDNYKINEDIITDLINEFKNLKSLLEERKINLNKPVEWNSDTTKLLLQEYMKKQVEIEEIKKAIINYFDSSGKSKKQLEDRVKKLFLEKYYVKLLDLNVDLKPIQYLETLSSKVEELKTSLEAKNVEYKEQLAKMKFESKYVNEYLQKLNISRFSVNIENTLEVIYKDSRRVKKSIKHSLSEGEKATLAFAYFLSKARVEISGNADNYTQNYKDYTFYVDDPISSLDENRLFYTANVLYSEFHEAEQLFVSSHNLKFLKILINYKFTTKSSEMSLYEIKYDKFSQIRNLPEALWNFNTTYYYKLHQIMEYLDSKVDYNIAICYIPNNLRVVLESFLSFKFCYVKSKNIGYTAGLPDLIEKVKSENKNYFKSLSDVEGINRNNWKDHLDIVISKVSDVFSHGSPSNMDIGYQPISDDELKSVCRTVINLMRFMDNVHFDKAEKLEPGDLAVPAS